MVIDTSALVAILCDEPDAERFEEMIDADPTRLISVASVLETAIVVENRFGESGGRELDLLILRLPIQVASIDREQLEWARIAFRRFGKGRHEAGLNFGDCFAYALAKVSGEPLLFKGQDFSRTDVQAARTSEKSP
jgi:ribonuclease VapC